MIQNNFIALFVTFLIALIWLRTINFLAHKKLIGSSLSRKIIHAGTGFVFVLSWLLFDGDLINRFLAALVPFAITLQFVLVGTGIIKDPSSVESMSRTGDRREILRGPLYYGIAFIVLTIFFWKENPIGIVGLMLLCGGDGLADIFGNRIASRKLPWSPKKSVAGSLAMFIGGLGFSLIVLYIYTSVGYFGGNLGAYTIPVILISIVATFVESIPLDDLDNLTIPAVAVILGLFLL